MAQTRDQRRKTHLLQNEQRTWCGSFMNRSVVTRPIIAKDPSRADCGNCIRNKGKADGREGNVKREQRSEVTFLLPGVRIIEHSHREAPQAQTSIG